MILFAVMNITVFFHEGRCTRRDRCV